MMAWEFIFFQAAMEKTGNFEPGEG